MRAAAKWLDQLPKVAVIGLVLGACGRDPPPAQPKPAAAADAIVAAPQVVAAAVPAALPSTATTDDVAAVAHWDRFGGLTRDVNQWQQGPVDGLCVVRGPGLDVAGLDDRLRDLTTALLGKPGVDQVLSRALDSEGRLVVRFQDHITATEAQAALARDQLANAARGGPALSAQTECTLLPRGQKARVIWQVVAPGGPQEATVLARSLQERLLNTVPCLTHVEVVGGVQQATTLEVQTKTLADNHVGFDQVLETLQSLALSPPDQWPQVLAEQQVTRKIKTTDGSPQNVPLSRLVARSGGLVSTPRTARNGQVAVTAVVAYGGQTCRPQELGRRVPELLVQAQATTKVRIQPVMTEGNVRLRLSLPRGTSYEGEASLAKKLHEIRMQPTVIGLYAQSSVDGVPVGWDVDGVGGRTWTVWLTDGEGEGMTVAMNAAHLLAATGWQVQPEPTGADTAVTWLLGQTAPAGLVLASSAADRVRGALGQATDLLTKVGGRQSLQNGPTRLTGDALAAAWRPVATSGQAPTALLLAVDALFRGPLTLSTAIASKNVADKPAVPALNTTLRVVLPGGERAVTAAAMPLTWVQPRDPAAKPTPVLLGALREEVMPSPVLERLRWNGRPTVWLSSVAFDRAPSAPEMELHQAIATLRVAEPSVSAWPWCERPELATDLATEPPKTGIGVAPASGHGVPTAPPSGTDRGPRP